MSDPIAFTIHPAGWFVLAFFALLWAASVAYAFWAGKREGREDEHHRAVMAANRAFLTEMNVVIADDLKAWRDGAS